MQRLLGLIVLMGVVACDNSFSRFDANETKVDGENGRSFFSIKADYKVIHTGEIVAFDYVGICAGSIKRWGDDKPRERRTNYPDLMIMPTQDGAALGIRTPAMCQSVRWGISGATDEPLPPEQYFIPEDYLPATLFYPNVNDLGFAFLYASDVAYDSPYSKLEFLGATIKRSTYQEWQDWRQRAAEAYEPIEGFPGPWGFNVGGRDVQDLEARVRAHNNGAGIANSFCTGFTKLEIPMQYQDLLSRYRPEDAKRYWLADEPIDGEYLKWALMKTSEPVFNHAKFTHHFGVLGGSGDIGIRTSSGKIYEPPGYGKAFYFGGGRFNRGNPQGNFYHDVYPVMTNAGEVSKDDGIVHRISQLYVSPEWRGFVFCNPNMRFSMKELEDYSLGLAPLNWTYPPSEQVDQPGIDFYVNEDFVQSLPSGQYHPLHVVVEDKAGETFVYLDQYR